ncbi:hypothetical protein SCB29_38115, partial [Paraburkholderia sp. SIMBA_055]
SHSATAIVALASAGIEQEAATPRIHGETLRGGPNRAHSTECRNNCFAGERFVQKGLAIASKRTL